MHRISVVLWLCSPNGSLTTPIFSMGTKEIISCIESFIALKSVLMRNSFKHIFGLDRNVGFQRFILVGK